MILLIMEFICFMIMFLFLPETRGRGVEEIVNDWVERGERINFIWSCFRFFQATTSRSSKFASGRAASASSRYAHARTPLHPRRLSSPTRRLLYSLLQSRSSCERHSLAERRLFAALEVCAKINQGLNVQRRSFGRSKACYNAIGFGG